MRFKASKYGNHNFLRILRPCRQLRLRERHCAPNSKLCVCVGVDCSLNLSLGTDTVTHNHEGLSWSNTTLDTIRFIM